MVNLFHYATSELSQDAFICWLLAHGMKEHQTEDPLLCACALDFIHRVPGLEHATEIKEIRSSTGTSMCLSRWAISTSSSRIRRIRTSTATKSMSIPTH